uniref:Uncharacterized protein n=1 Tax=Thermosporothrix sp. COM3 TaxID=2490863 RepID=A0A455SXV9_9CHLR|nr:hypothetical protein KTC_64730 [Thermosporothrix sp. COM3]
MQTNNDERLSLIVSDTRTESGYPKLVESSTDPSMRQEHKASRRLMAA